MESAKLTSRPFLASLAGWFGASQGVRRRILRNLSLKTLAEVLPRGLAFLVILMIARLLGEEDFGLFSYALSIGALAALPVDLGWNTMTTRRLAGGNGGPVVRAALLYKFWATIAVGAVLIGLTEIFQLRAPGWMVLCLFVVAICNYLQDFMGAVAIGIERIEWEAVVKFIPRVLILAVLGVLMLKAAPNNGVILGFVAANVIGSAIAGAWFFSRVPGWRERAGWSDVVRFSREALTFGAVSSLWIIYVRMDLILLGYNQVPAAAMGHYATAARLFELGRLAPLIVQLSLIPIFSSYAADVARVSRQAVKMSGYLIAPAAATVLAGFYFGDDAVVLLFGDAFSRAYEPLRIGIPAIAVFLLNVPIMAALIALRRERALLVTSALMFGLNLTVNIVFIPTLGFLAPAWAFVASEVAWLALNAGMLAAVRIKAGEARP